ncbi:MAG TPA: helix-turn-helix transcriptional regulator [Streptosporangiaceae bacterium]|nr:helix-turn-helix transcriptional regulator [Streptosporangiaceae bacterium]
MAELKRLREASGLSQEAVAGRLDWHPTKMMRIETGRTAPHPNDVRLMLDVYGITSEDQAAALVKLARDARQRGWWYSGRDVPPNRHDFYVGLESGAASIRDFALTLVPALLQTQDYAHALIQADPVNHTPDEVGRRAGVLMTRQGMLDRPSPPLLWAVLDESAIRRAVGGPEVMRTQLEHLIAASGQGRATIQVLPCRAVPHPGLAAPFTILSFAGTAAPDTVYQETVGGSLYVDKPQETRLFATVFDHLCAVALSPAETRAMLRTAADKLT